jgi:Homeodomain-like domain
MAGSDGDGLTPEDRSDPCESFSRPGSWARKERNDEAKPSNEGADPPQAARGRAALGEGKTIPEAAKELGISEQTYHRWRNRTVG